MNKQIITLFLLILQGLLVISIAPMIIGWINQIKCWLQQRRAPTLFQPYFTIYKLLFKESVLADNASWLFRVAPYIYFILIAGTCFSLPFFTITTLTARNMDMIIIVGLLALARILLALAAMDVGTAFGSLGARREMFVACCSEPILLIIFYNVVLLTHSPYLSGSTAYFIDHPLLLHPSLIFSLLALILITLAETGRIPIDNPATHLELTMIHEAMILEYSGRYLALIEWGNAIKFTLYLGFILSIFFPMGLSLPIQISRVLFGLATTLLKLFILAAFIGFIESINSKLRLFKVPDYLASAFMLTVLGVLITQLLGTPL
ncbi:MAG: NADH-quinone oxidoreductase subunit H [Pseudomonadota bacterium]